MRLASLYNLKNILFTPQPTDVIIHDFLASINLPSISIAKSESLTQPFTTDGILSVIKALSLRKSPGEDGFSNAFYKNLPPF